MPCRCCRGGTTRARRRRSSGRRRRPRTAAVARHCPRTGTRRRTPRRSRTAPARDRAARRGGTGRSSPASPRRRRGRRRRARQCPQPTTVGRDGHRPRRIYREIRTARQPIRRTLRTGGMRDDDGDLQLAELLDSSFGAGPDGLPTPSERLAAGRQALRRRRRAGIAGTTVAVVAVVGLGAALSGAVGGRSDADGPLPPLATSGTADCVRVRRRPNGRPPWTGWSRRRSSRRTAWSSRSSAPCSRRRSVPTARSS